eukprot:m51a1_g9114 hypothetical protein (405) ;mRNA; f:122346-124152
MPRRVKKRSCVNRGAVCDEVALIVLFSQAHLFSFPDIWRLRLVSRAWRRAIESSGVLSSHIAQRRRISRLHNSGLSAEGLRDLLLVDHIVEVVRASESKGLCTSSVQASLRLFRMADTLRRLALAAATAACSVLGPIEVTDTMERIYGHQTAGPSVIALTALAIARAAAELVSGPTRYAARPIKIAIIECSSGGRCIECLGGDGPLLVVPPGTSCHMCRKALERSFGVFARVCRIAEARDAWGIELVTAETGVLPLSYYNSLEEPREQHLWIGMLLFRKSVADLAGVKVYGNEGNHGVDLQRKCVRMPWDHFNSRLDALAKSPQGTEERLVWLEGSAAMQDAEWEGSDQSPHEPRSRRGNSAWGFSDSVVASLARDGVRPVLLPRPLPDAAVWSTREASDPAGL